MLDHNNLPGVLGQPHEGERTSQERIVGAGENEGKYWGRIEVK